MKVTPALLQKIKEAVNILDVVGEHVVLRKSGANHSGLCPFHSERSPSFSVSEGKQLYHCYGCKKGGDLVSFVMDIQGISFPEAVEELAERARIPLPRFEGGDGSADSERLNQLRKKQALAFKLNRFAATYFHKFLLASSQNGQNGTSGPQIYCRDRGVSSTQMQEFYMGAAADAWDSLAIHLKNAKAPLDVAVELGLIRPSTQTERQRAGVGYFDLFRNRILFPILNLKGKVAGFGGRILTDEKPKYLNSPDSLVYQKSKLAFGLFQAQKYIREQDEVILVEGYFDVLGLHAVGIKNVVSTCGTALTPEHLRILSRLAKRVIILFDGDKAGLAATDRAMEVGLESGHVLYGAFLPQGLDPDQLVFDPANRGGIFPDAREKVAAILGTAQPLLDVRIREALDQAKKSPEDRVQALKRVGAWLGRFTDPVGREVRTQLLQKELSIPRQLVVEAGTSKEGRTRQAPSPAPISVSTDIASKPKRAELTRSDRLILMGLAQEGEFLQHFLKTAKDLPPDMTLASLMDAPIAQEYIQNLIAHEGKSAELTGDLHPEIRSALSGALLAEAQVGLGDFQGTLMKKGARSWARFSQQIKAALAEAEVKNNTELQVRFMKEYLDVQRKMKDFSSFYDEA